MTIESDASNTDWGACWNNQKMGGHWSFQQSQLHINAKEMLAAFLALQTFTGNRKGINVLLKINNPYPILLAENHRRCILLLLAKMGIVVYLSWI